jgi:hypothetical protein
VILALPHLINWDNFPNHEKHVSAEVQAQVYHILRETLLSFVGEGEDGHWLPTYEAEMARASSQNSRNPQSSGKLIPGNSVSKFSKEFLCNIQGELFGGDAYYICSLQGTRSEMVHEATKASHLEAFSTLMGMLDEGAIDPEKWWVDIGHEIQIRDNVLWWREDSHLRIVAEALKLEDAPALRLVNSTNYQVNHAANLTEAAGFRLVIPQTVARPSGVFWMQLYCTEKMATYLPGGKTSQLNPRILLKNPENELTKFNSMLDTVFTACAEYKTRGNARLEVRVQLSQFRREDPFIIRLRPELVVDCIYKFPSRDWW